VIVGTGDIARVLPIRDDLLFFASGVSDSQCTDEHKYDREVRLLLSQDERAHIVYFSSLAIFFTDTRYTQHKKYMEALIHENFSNWTILRIGNIDWGYNPHTLINYLRAHPEAKVRDEYRYIVDKDELLYWVDAIPPWNCEMNIVGKRMKVKKIKEKYCVEK
jgi:hypothetical protein